MTTSDESCGYCCYPLGELEDCRWLPCGHIFCYGCLVAHFKMSSQLQCICCRKEYKGMDIDSLQPYHNKQAPRCNACEVDAAKYCSECEKNLCKDHLKLHEDFLTSIKASHHLQLPGANQKSPVKEQKRFCTEHPTEDIRRACSACYKLLCIECTCTIINRCESSGKAHSIEKVEELSGKLRQNLMEMASELYNKSLFHDDLEKQANIILHQKQLECDEGKALVDKVTKQQVDELEQKASNLKSELDKMYDRSKELVAGYSSELLTSKSKLDEVRQELHSVSHLESDYELICGYTMNINKAKSFINAPIQDFSLPTCQIKHLGNKTRELEVQMLDLGTVKVIEPSKYAAGSTTDLMKTINREATEPMLLSSTTKCYSHISWLSYGTLACGAGDKIDVVDRSLEIIDSFNLGDNYGRELHINTLAQVGQFYYALLNDCTSKRSFIDLYTSEWSFDMRSDNFPYLGADFLSSILDHTVLIIDRQSKDCCMYDLWGNSMRTYELSLSSITGAQLVYPDAFVVCDFEAGNVHMISNQSMIWHDDFYFNQHSGQNEWTRSGLQRPLGLCMDEYNLIYVLSIGEDKQLALYILSTEGEVIKDLVLLEQVATQLVLYSMSVLDHVLAVASSSGVSLYHLDGFE